LILEDKIDDIKAFLPEDMIQKLDDYARQVWEGVHEEMEFIRGDAMNQWLLSNRDRKTFAQRTDGAKGRQFWFKAVDLITRAEADASFDWHNAFNDYFIDYLKSQTGSQSKVDDIRWILKGAKWDV
jgi:hypothetical protein